MNIELQSMAIDLPPVGGHPNRLAFCGVLTLLDSPSDRPPSGARGHRVLLTREAGEAALPSLLGMGLDYAAGLDRHEPRRKVGIITEAEIVDSVVVPQAVTQGISPFARGRGRPQDSRRDGGATLGGRPRDSHPDGGTTLQVAGYLFARDFPDVVRELRNAAGALGMSYEITDARVEDVRARVWTVTEFTFTGAAVLRRDKAAYRSTWIELESPVAARASGSFAGNRYQPTGDSYGLPDRDASL